MTTQPTPSAPTAAAPGSARPRATPAQNLVTILVSWWLMIGIFIDGWAHNTLGESLETFFTPWHAVFYSGYLVTALWVGFLVWRGLREGRRGLAAVPVGYGMALLGVPVFALGGLGDLTWHTIFGIEVGIEALLSPTHLLLFLGAELLALAPLVASWRAPTPRRSAPGVVWPAVLSMTAGLSFASFMHMYLWGLYRLPTGLGFDSTAGELAGILVTSVILTAPVLLLVRRWQLPFGAVTWMYGVNGALMVVLAPWLGDARWRVLLVGLVAGLLTDTLIALLRPSPGRVLYLRSFSLALPLTVWLPFLGGATVLGLMRASPELWLGVTVMASLGGLALSALVVPPDLPREARE
ncbi:hypothetical protein [Deinococcus pimensis]|uniref:hypothetical protein n=1 Tax=Deinococcus pimensis TaxID=309888 RepID=UPI000488BDB4|nr:hypothetical protein [Deinococcus pimensis]